MIEQPKRYLVTSALPYANGLKHIGHLAGAYVPADIYVRYLRAQKRDVVFVCGSDEHGAAITIQAMKEGTTPKAIVDKYHEILKQNFTDFSISFDIYHRTSSPLHHETAQEFFTALNSKGDLEVKESEQYFDEAANTFLADRFIIGTCPVCSNPNAYGDQCERCGSTLSPDQLINPHSTLSGNQPIKKATKHWYLPLDRHEDFLKRWILEEHKSDWKTNVLGQCKSWIDAGLQPRAVTRDLDWGVKVPASPTPPKEGLLTPKDFNYTSQTEEDFDSSLVEEGEEVYGYYTADPTTYALLKDFVKTHRSRPTEAEIALWEMLRDKKLGHKFRRQHIIGNFITDFVCLSQKLIVEVDGSIHQLPNNKLSDEERTAELNKLGFEVIRFLNGEVLQEPDKVLSVISQKLKEASSIPPKEGLHTVTDLPFLQEIQHTVKPNSEAKQSGLSPSFGGVGEAGKVLYVWFDAPIGYISATKQWALDTGKDWQPYWNDKDTKLVHFVGKDNIVFHCIIFPVMLQLHGNILPDNVPANEFMNLEGDKMSTSRGWSIEMDEYINDWIKPENGGPQMADVLRYYLTTISPETKDSEFTWKGFQEANNSELVNIFGNFVNRSMVLMHKLTRGKVPALHTAILDEDDKKIMEDITASKAKIEALLEGYKFREALFEIIDLSRKGNGYLQKKQPWIVAKQISEDGQPTADAQQSIDVTLHLCLQLCANLAIYINPFLPNTAQKICYMLKVVDRMLDWENAGKLKLLSTGYNLREPQLLFRKIENTEIEAQMKKLQEKASPTPPKEGLQALSTPPKGELKTVTNSPSNTDMETPHTTSQNSEAPQSALSPSFGGVGEAKSIIQFDDFAKINLKVGTITAAEKVQKADKLLKLSVDLGFETRTIVSGIALHFAPEEIVGKQVTVVTNLAPRKMRGIESQGMILMAEDAQGKLHFINPEEKITAGAGVS